MMMMKEKEEEEEEEEREAGFVFLVCGAGRLHFQISLGTLTPNGFLTFTRLDL